MPAGPLNLDLAVRDAERKLTDYRIIQRAAETLAKRDHSGGPVAIDSPQGDQIVVSTTWLVAALAEARSEGFREGRSIIQPLCDYANNDSRRWRDVMEEHVVEPTLADILDSILERA